MHKYFSWTNPASSSSSTLGETQVFTVLLCLEPVGVAVTAAVPEARAFVLFSVEEPHHGVVLAAAGVLLMETRLWMDRGRERLLWYNKEVLKFRYHTRGRSPSCWKEVYFNPISFFPGCHWFQISENVKTCCSEIFHHSQQSTLLHDLGTGHGRSRKPPSNRNTTPEPKLELWCKKVPVVEMGLKWSQGEDICREVGLLYHAHVVSIYEDLLWWIFHLQPILSVYIYNHTLEIRHNPVVGPSHITSL